MQIDTAKQKLHQVMEAWPKTAFDQLHELCCLADTNLQNWTTDAMAKLEEYHARAFPGGHKEPDALVAKTVKLLSVSQQVTKGRSVATCGRMALPLPKRNQRSLKYLHA